MSHENEIEGMNHYIDGGTKVRDWFERQWAAWPDRVDQRYTTNLSFLYGGIKGYRISKGLDPKLSDDLAYNVDFLDRNQ